MTHSSVIFALNTARRVYGWGQRFTGYQNSPSLPALDYSGQAASNVIKSKILAPEPFMIGRFGGTEMTSLMYYHNIQREPRFPMEKSVSYVMGLTRPFWWDKMIKYKIQYLSGFFPATPEYLERFCEQMLQDIKEIDILGSWLPEEQILRHRMSQAITVKLQDLEPYYHEHPWSEALQGKTVLVIHPFAKTIEQQYQKRELLFQNPDILPEFTLKTLKSVQSIAGNNCDFPDWFAALEWMIQQISNIQFDIAIIGAGAYGLPLAAQVKRLGKKGIHLGGATQILFGIRGKRWDDDPFFQKLFNDHWVRPLSTEVPGNFQVVEGGCYW
ncbi:hypothetical protein GlitD10_0911 [Gloeomargarita lithophora Alchichica-D10]|uniref:Uncharacterized protein n=1 Tax=Gloeomargarita lithophora Alchichica-D10 TaxID=1188229 RepID=A0A1J0ABD7_9CYAN|nr:hypothetical protein [Gloeomargarita lithophora]APB33229.1 hypothetical protein GlitD10_0911 [Gloeomargarita lithophora Alchichica-D10]